MLKQGVKIKKRDGGKEGRDKIADGRGVSITDTVKENAETLDKSKVEAILKEFALDQGTLDCFVKKNDDLPVVNEISSAEEEECLAQAKHKEEDSDSDGVLEHLESTEEKKENEISPELTFLASMKSNENNTVASTCESAASAASTAASTTASSVVISKASSKKQTPVKLPAANPVKSKLIQ